LVNDVLLIGGQIAHQVVKHFLPTIFKAVFKRADFDEAKFAVATMNVPSVFPAAITTAACVCRADELIASVRCFVAIRCAAKGYSFVGDVGVSWQRDLCVLCAHYPFTLTQTLGFTRKIFTFFHLFFHPPKPLQMTALRGRLL